MWLLILTREELRAIAYPDGNVVQKASIVVQEPPSLQSVNAVAGTDEQAEPTASSIPTPVPDTRPSVTITLQDRYKLPAKREGSLHTGSPSDVPALASTNQRLTKDEYDSVRWGHGTHPQHRSAWVLICFISYCSVLRRWRSEWIGCTPNCTHYALPFNCSRATSNAT
jgi:hypothetical protein